MNLFYYRVSLPGMDTENILKVLEFDPAKETIHGVLARMKELLKFFGSNPQYKRLIPFLETYHIVTETVLKKRIESPNFYDNPEDLERLDVVFASLYFKPLKTYLETGKSEPPWAGYFSYCEKDGIPFLQMLLGINTHINSDLCTSVVSVDYTQKRDFFLMNDILKEVIPKVMHFLAFSSHDIFGLGGMIFRGFMRREFYKTVVQWRQNAWDNAHVISTASRHDYQNRLFECTEETCTRLIKVFHDIRMPMTIPKLNLKLQDALVRFK